MKERIEELNDDKAEGESTVLSKIATMPEPDRTLGKWLHAIIRAAAPGLMPSPTAASAEFDKIVATALTADMMISCLGVKADDRLQMYKRWTSGLRHLPDKDFRTRLTKLSDMVAESYLSPNRECAMSELRDVIEIMKKLPALGKKLAKLQDENKLSNTIVNIYDSMVHMHCNRILGIDQDAEASTRIMMKRALEILLAKPA